MSHPLIPTDGAVPLDGDIAVTRESAVSYGLRQLPGKVQFRVSSREEGVRLGQAFGEEHAVNVWYSENGTNCLLTACRPAAAARARG